VLAISFGVGVWWSLVPSTEVANVVDLPHHAMFVARIPGYPRRLDIDVLRKVPWLTETFTAPEVSGFAVDDLASGVFRVNRLRLTRACAVSPSALRRPRVARAGR
jgi:hypothetical protein